MATEQKPLSSGFGPLTTAAEIVEGVELRGKVAVVTGGHGGIGLETTRALAKAHAAVVVGARDLAKAGQNLAGIANVRILALDLTDPGSIDRFADEVLSAHGALDLLINNAGIMATPELRDRRNYELQFATNHLGHFQLTLRLREALKKAGGARVVNLTSAGHRFAGVDLDDPNFLRRPYDKWKAYGQSKTANSLFTVELDRRAAAEGMRAFAVHPGRIVDTDLIRSLTEEDMKAMGVTRENGVVKSAVALKNVQQGAATTLWCALSPRLDGKGGVYCADCDIAEIVPDDSQSGTGVRRWAIDPEKARALWTLSETLVSRTWG